MSPKIGVVLAGCGHRDGGEIHEITCTLLALVQHGAEPVCMAPNKNQHDVLDHLTGKPMFQERNILVEAARIARGKIQPIDSINPDTLDGLILPGGFGVAKNICSFAEKKSKMTVIDEVTNLVHSMVITEKPMGFICIAPVIAAYLFGRRGVLVTVGNDSEVADIVANWGAQHRECSAEEVVVDQTLRIVTTPAYMNAQNIAQVYTGINMLVQEVLKMRKPQQ